MGYTIRYGLVDGLRLGMAGVILGGLIALIVWGIKKLSEQGGYTPKHGPLDVAKEPYAKGEVSREEFEQIRKDPS